MAKAGTPLPGWAYLALIVAAAYLPPWLLSWRAGSSRMPRAALPEAVSQGSRDSTGISADAGTGEGVPSRGPEFFEPDFSEELPRSLEDVLKEAEVVDARLRLRFPDSSDAVAAVAEYCVMRGRETEAESLLRRHLREHPEAEGCLFVLGEILLERGDLVEAEDVLKRCVRDDSGSAYAYDSLSRLYALRGDHEAAKAYAAEFEKRKPDWDEKTTLLRFAGDLGEAARQLSTLETRAAKVYDAHGDARRAEEYLRRALAIHAANREARRTLAAVYERLGNDFAAAAVLEEWRRIDPDDTVPYLLLAAFYGGRRDFLRTQEVLAAAVARFPDNPVPQALLAKFYIDTGEKPDEAAALAEKVVAGEPSAVNYELLSEAYLSCGRLDAAEKALRQSREQDPSNPRLPHLESRIREAQAAAEKKSQQRERN